MRGKHAIPAVLDEPTAGTRWTFKRCPTYGRGVTSDDDPLGGQALNVQELKRIADDKETAKLKEVLARRQKEEDEEKRARQDFMERELQPDGIDRFNGWVRRAAEQGRSEIEILRFPSQCCRTTAGRSTTSRGLAGHADRRGPQGL